MSHRAATARQLIITPIYTAHFADVSLTSADAGRTNSTRDILRHMARATLMPPLGAAESRAGRYGRRSADAEHHAFTSGRAIRHISFIRASRAFG